MVAIANGKAYLQQGFASRHDVSVTAGPGPGSKPWRMLAHASSQLSTSWLHIAKICVAALCQSVAL